MASFDSSAGDVARVIQLAVAPVFLLSGVGVTLGVFTNRLARIVDRARAIEVQLEKNARDETLRGTLKTLARRASWINTAITLAALSALMVALTVGLLFLHVLAGVHLASAVAITFGLAMLTLTAALLAFLVEVRIATATLRIGTYLN